MTKEAKERKMEMMKLREVYTPVELGLFKWGKSESFVLHEIDERRLGIVMLGNKVVITDQEQKSYLRKHTLR